MDIRKPKFINNVAINRLQQYDGKTLFWDLDCRPSWLQRFDHVYASACAAPRRELWGTHEFIDVIGGVDVFRPAQDWKDGVLYNWNKDHYVTLSNSTICLVGPFGKGIQEHWLIDLPPGLDTAGCLRI